MSEVYSKIKGIIKTLKLFKLYEAILDSIILFMVIYIIFLFLKINGLFALVFALAFFVYKLIVYFKFDIMKEVVSRYPKLNERLQTAYDNRDAKGIIVADLSQRVSKDMDEIKFSSFFPTKNISKKVLTIVVLSFVMISLTFANVQKYVDISIEKILSPSQGNNASSQPNQTDKLTNKTPKNRTRLGYSGEDTGESNIMGDPSLANIEGENIDFKIYRGISSELGIRRATQTELPEFGTSAQFPVDAVASSENVDNIPLVYQGIIKNYFTNLAKLQQ